MAYWNPFGWDEETRRGIQSIVRPVMQVASFAGSMGAFSGGSAAAGTGATDPGTAPTLPEGVDPGTPGIQEWNTDMDIDAPGTFTPDPPPVETPGTPQPTTMSVPDSTTQLQSLTPEQQVNQNVAESYATYRDNPTQENLDLYNDSLQNIDDFYNKDAVPIQQQAGPQYNKGDTLDPNNRGNAQSFTSDKEGNFIVTETTQPKPTQTTTQPKPTTTTQKTEAKAKTADSQEIKDTAPESEGKPRGGKEKSFWEGGFNWENIQKFLASDEGKKWMLSDKGLMGIGRRISQASEGGASIESTLTEKELKELRKKLKERREKRKKDRRERGE